MLLVRTYGHDADCVLDAHKVFEVVRAERPDLVILDVNMPGMSGIDVLRRLKRDAVTAAVVVVMFSAADSEEARDDARDAGASDYWVKSATAVRTLEARINACLRAAKD
jgi:DNA-binding response OmpR family regulator